MSDQAAEFTGQVISELCDLLGVTKIRMSPYHPQTNGTIERVRQTLRRMIAKMDPDKRAKWPLHLGPILIAYNATRSLITDYSPYFLMFGRQPRLPVDLLFPNVRPDENSRTTDEYVTSLYNKLKSALALARDTAILEAQRQKRIYHRKDGVVELYLGDKVLVKLDTFRRLQQLNLIRVDGGFISSIFSWFLVTVGLVVGFKPQVLLLINRPSTMIFLVAWRNARCPTGHLLLVSCQNKGILIGQRGGCEDRGMAKPAGACAPTIRGCGCAGLESVETPAATQRVVIVVHQTRLA